jgi:hypothetical protein
LAPVEEAGLFGLMVVIVVRWRLDMFLGMCVAADKLELWRGLGLFLLPQNIAKGHVDIERRGVSSCSMFDGAP